MAATKATLEVMHAEHGIQVDRTCGECQFLVQARRRFVAMKGYSVDEYVCRQYPERLIKSKRPPFAKSWQACGAFKPVI